MVWLAKHDPGFINELERLIDQRDRRHTTKWISAAAALIELEHSRRLDAERYLLEEAMTRSPSWFVIRLIVGKLDSPESFLQLVELHWANPTQLKPLIMEIIRRRGQGALPILLQARELSQRGNQRKSPTVWNREGLLWAVYRSIAELEGLHLVWDHELRRSVGAGDKEFPALLKDSPDLAWQSLMERLDSVLEEAG